MKNGGVCAKVRRGRGIIRHTFCGWGPEEEQEEVEKSRISRKKRKKKTPRIYWISNHEGREHIKLFTKRFLVILILVADVCGRWRRLICPVVGHRKWSHDLTAPKFLFCLIAAQLSFSRNLRTPLKDLFWLFSQICQCWITRKAFSFDSHHLSITACP